MVRKFTKSKAIFPTDDSIRKIIFMSVKEISKKWTMPVRDWGLAYSQLAIFFEDRFAAWRLMRVPPSNSRGLSALGIFGEDEEKQQHFCHCSSPFYSAACVGSLLSVALFGCKFSMSIFWRLLRLHGLIFRTEYNENSQLVLSSIGFVSDKFSAPKPINVITLENEKYHLLDESTYEKYFHFLSELCDAE